MTKQTINQVSENIADWYEQAREWGLQRSIEQLAAEANEQAQLSEAELQGATEIARQRLAGICPECSCDLIDGVCRSCHPYTYSEKEEG